MTVHKVIINIRDFVDNLDSWIPVLESQSAESKKRHHWDFPGGSVVKTPHTQCRGTGFDPWSGN